MKLSDNLTRTFIYVSALLLLAYTIIRAYLLSFTWDEAYTYLEFVRKPFWIPQAFNSMAANDHLLNTWLMKICASIFGISEFSLRLPNLFAHVIYLVFSARLAKMFGSNILTLLAFFLLNLNPYLLDFFSAARGYGLSMGLMMASLYFLFSFFSSDKKFKAILFSILFSILALLANLNLFPFFLIVSAIGFVSLFMDLFRKESKKDLLLKLFFISGICLITIYLMLSYAIKLKDCGSLFFGGETGYFNDTFVSLFWQTLYERHPLFPLAIFLAVLFLALLSIAVILTCYWVITKKIDSKNRNFTILTALAIFCFITPLVQHYLIGTKYPMQRTGLFFWPLFALLFVFLIQRIAKEKWRTGLAFISMLFMLINSALSFNFHSLLNWQEDADLKEGIADLSSTHDPVFPHRFNITLGSDWMFDPSINYYRQKNELTWLNTIDHLQPSELCDYYLINDHWASKTPHIKKIRTISKDVSFYKNERVISDTLLLDQKWDFDATTDDQGETKGITSHYFFSGKRAAYTDTAWQYSKGLDFAFTDSMVRSKIVVSVSAMILAVQNNFEGSLVIAFVDKDGTNYSWQDSDVRDVITGTGKWVKINFTRFSNEKLKAGDRVAVYLWNRGLSTICLDDLHVKIIAVDE